MERLPHSESNARATAQRQADIQRAKAAAAEEAFSPEALAAEAKRQEVIREAEAAEWRAAERAICDAKGEDYRPEILEPSPVLEGGVDDTRLSIPTDDGRNTPLRSRLAEVPEGGVDNMVYEGSPIYESNVIKGVAQPAAPDTSVPVDEEAVLERLAGQRPDQSRQSRLAERLLEIVEQEEEGAVEAEVEEVPSEVMGGAHLVRWILLPADESDGWTLGLSTESHEDEQPDAVYLEITQAMMRKWRNAPANANDLERFAAGIMEKVADALAEDLTDRLIECLQRITTGELRERQHLDPPTETSIGPDDDGPEVPFGPGVEAGDDGEVGPFESLEAYITARDYYSQTLSRDEYVAFLSGNQDLEDEIERLATDGE